MPGAAPKIFITMGDVNGIGPEITLKSIKEVSSDASAVFTILGSTGVLDFYQKQLGFEQSIVVGEPNSDPSQVHFIPVDLPSSQSFEPGAVKPDAGEASIRFIERALELIGSNHDAALVTAPISKQAIWQSGIDFPGQTELLGSWYGTDRTVMMMISDKLRVGLATTHFPLREVPDLLTRDLIVKKCLTICDDLQRRFHIKTPRLAVAALNPHAGEGGLLGKEEEEMIKPAVNILRDRKVSVDGPMPSDTLFGPEKLNTYDAFLAMYHDQGMIAVKMVAFGRAVNYTAGLPIVRTSPDHGTAFDIAGRGIADASSMVEAIKFAIGVVRQKRRTG
ncbi:MAG: 4-hydroxythreonine-4-phosphate dehydrogenase PdxA [bacterium]